MWKIFIFVKKCFCGIVDFIKMLLRSFYMTIKTIITNKMFVVVVVVVALFNGLLYLNQVMEQEMVKELNRRYLEELPDKLFEERDGPNQTPQGKVPSSFYRMNMGCPNFISAMPPYLYDDDQNERFWKNEPKKNPDQEKWKQLAHIMRFGYPGMDTIRHYENFVVSYDRVKRIPNWTYEHLTNKRLIFPNLPNLTICPTPRWDHGIDPLFSPNVEDYKQPNIIMRRLVPIENHWESKKSVEQTFLFTNIIPQRSTTDSPPGDYWNRFDQHVRNLTRTYKNVYLCMGPLFLPHKAKNGKTYVRYEVIGKNNVAVPTHVFRVVMAEKSNRELEMWCYLVKNKVMADNQKQKLEQFYIDPEKLEKISGLLFLQGVSLVQFTKVNGQPNPLRNENFQLHK